MEESGPEARCAKIREVCRLCQRFLQAEQVVKAGGLNPKAARSDGSSRLDVRTSIHHQTVQAAEFRPTKALADSDKAG